MSPSFLDAAELVDRCRIPADELDHHPNAAGKPTHWVLPSWPTGQYPVLFRSAQEKNQLGSDPEAIANLETIAQPLLPLTGSGKDLIISVVMLVKKAKNGSNRRL